MRLARGFLIHRHFREPRSSGFYMDARAAMAFAAIFHESVHDTILTLKAEGHLVPAYTEPISRDVYRTYMRRMFLGTSAKLHPLEPDEDALDRMLTNEPDKLAQMFRDLDLCIASSSGHLLAREYALRRETAKAVALEAFVRRDIPKALDAAEHLAQDLGVPLGALDQRPQPALWLETLANAAPKVLAPLPSSLLEQLREEIAISAIFQPAHRETPRDWTPEEKGFVPFHREDAIHLLTSATSNQHMLLCLRKINVQRVNICACGGIFGGYNTPTCDACLALCGTTWPIDKVPELPHPECTTHLGCRCTIRPAYQPPTLEKMSVDSKFIQ
jgi:hypothetical protein